MIDVVVAGACCGPILALSGRDRELFERAQRLTSMLLAHLDQCNPVSLRLHTRLSAIQITQLVFSCLSEFLIALNNVFTASYLSRSRQVFVAVLSRCLECLHVGIEPGH